MRLYNTLSRQEEEFAPQRDGIVRMYACGLTVYARGHIGNFRTFLAVDLLRRTLRHVAGFGVHHVTNFTDVDDKTIAEAQKAGVPLREYTTRFIDAFREDAAALGLEAPEDTPRATDQENLVAMADMIAALEQRGHTYRSEGSIYFKISHPAAVRPAGAARSRRHDQLAPASTATSTRRRTRATSSSGRPPRPTSRRGIAASAPAVPAGTSSAPRWRCGCSARRRSTSTAAAST